MLVTFRSTATESVTMFGNIATALLKLMGASGRVPGAFTAQDVPSALRRLEEEIERLKAVTHEDTPAPPTAADDDPADRNDREEREPPIALATRAVPLITMMRRAAAAGAEVIWEGK